MGLLLQTLRDVRAQKARALVTVLGITWGTMAVALLVALGEGLVAKNISNMQALGRHVVFAWPGQTSMPCRGLPKGRRLRLAEPDVEALRREVAGARFSAEYAVGRMAVRRGDVRLSAWVSGTSPEFAAIRSFVPAPGGRYVNALDVARRRRVVFLGDRLARDLFGSAEPVGGTVMLGDAPFAVIGVMRTRLQEGAAEGNPDGDNAFVPGTTAVAMSGSPWLEKLVFQGHDPRDGPSVTGRVLEVLARRHAFDPRDRLAVATWDTGEGERFMSVFYVSLRVLLAIIGTCTLIVGGIGVSNIVYVVLEERTPEIGVLMALGARPRYIQAHFLLEALLLTAAGGMLGFALTAGALAVLPRLGVEQYLGEPQASPAVIVTTTVLLGIVGFTAGYFPARRASLLDPVAALKPA